MNNMIVKEKQKYFTAEEARRIADEISSNQMKDELDWIYKLIDNALFEGKHEVTFSNKTLLKSTKAFLENKGYTIKHFSGVQWDPADDTTISW